MKKKRYLVGISSKSKDIYGTASPKDIIYCNTSSFGEYDVNLFNAGEIVDA
jgi:hypothetical protein